MTVLTEHAPPPIETHFEYVLVLDDVFYGPIEAQDIGEGDKNKYGYIEIADVPYFHDTLRGEDDENHYVFWRADNTVSAPFNRKALKELELSESSHIRRFKLCLYF